MKREGNPGRRLSASLRPGGNRARRSGSRRSAQGNVREAAAWVVERTLASMAPADAFLEGALERCDRRDHGLLYELVLGTLRWLKRIDDVIARASNRSFDRIEEALRAPLRVAVYQLLFLDRVPAHAVVHEAVDEALHRTHRGGSSFVNAVLRRVAREGGLGAWPVQSTDPVRRLSIELSHPELLVRRWLECFGERRAVELMRANNRQKPMHLAAFVEAGGREVLAESLIDQGIEVEPSSLSPLGLKVRSGNALHTDAFRRGRFYIQDEASQVAALIPPPAAGQSVLDVAAAPGGKTFALLGYEPSLRAVAADVSIERLRTLAANLERLRCSVPVVLSDGARPAFAERRFDRVVVDLPCSGTGTLRRHPEIKWRLREEELDRLAREGLTLLDEAAACVRPGGLLISVTCSIEPEENELLVKKLLARRSDLRPIELAGRLDELGAAVADCVTSRGAWQLLPGDDHDGFTVHVLERVET